MRGFGRPGSPNPCARVYTSGNVKAIGADAPERLLTGTAHPRRLNGGPRNQSAADRSSFLGMGVMLYRPVLISTLLLSGIVSTASTGFAQRTEEPTGPPQPPPLPGGGGGSGPGGRPKPPPVPPPSQRDVADQLRKGWAPDAQ